MDDSRFDTAVRGIGLSRRTVAEAAIGIASALAGASDAGTRKRKKTCAKSGQATNRKRKRCCSGLVTDIRGVCASPATPPTTSPPCVMDTCPDNFCGTMANGCGAMRECTCQPDHVCVQGVCKPCITVDGVCQPCTVTCRSSDPEFCRGQNLRDAIHDGGLVYVCPGRYTTHFDIYQAVRIVGAGSGSDPTVDTILDGGRGFMTMSILDTAGVVELERLRVTGGRWSGAGAGISHFGTTLRLTDCAVSGNSMSSRGAGIMVYPGRTLDMLRCHVADNRSDVSDPGDGGGGIATHGVTTLTDCLVEGNHADTLGGGLLVLEGTTSLLGSTIVRDNFASRGGGIANIGTLIIGETCRITGNSASAPGEGGGIANDVLGAVTLQGNDPSPIVVDNCHDNCRGPIPKCAAEPVSCSD